MLKLEIFKKLVGPEIKKQLETLDTKKLTESVLQKPRIEPRESLLEEENKMAENFSDMFEGCEDKSIEELGSSLLSRQAEINQQQQAKKSRRIQQFLALIGVGQQLFKNVYNKREIEEYKLQ